MLELRASSSSCSLLDWIVSAGCEEARRRASIIYRLNLNLRFGLRKHSHFDKIKNNNKCLSLFCKEYYPWAAQRGPIILISVVKQFIHLDNYAKINTVFIKFQIVKHDERSCNERNIKSLFLQNITDRYE